MRKRSAVSRWLTHKENKEEGLHTNALYSPQACAIVLDGKYPQLVQTCMNGEKAFSNKYSVVNLFIKTEKKFSNNSRKRRREFKDATGLNLTLFPILIRFETWLNCMKYHIEHGRWEKVKKFFLDCKFDSNVSPAQLGTMKKILSGTKLESDFIAVSRYVGIPDIITKLEARDLTADDQFKLLNQVKDIIAGSEFESKLTASLFKNPDLISFFSNQNSLTDRLNKVYCPINSCDVESSFSSYKSLLSDKRRLLSPVNLKMMMIIKFNQNLYLKYT